MVDAAAPLAHTPLGTIRGTWDGDAALFAGIRYAEAPTGERRFRPPVPASAWSGELDATTFGPICPQNPSMIDAVFGHQNPAQDEDCLALNIWSPAFVASETADASTSGSSAKLPVLVWIHGGGFEMGAGSQAMYSGKAFADSGVVFVSINYRLGTLGFMELGSLDSGFAGSANNGLRDQLCAIRWVNDNISAFGGDPSNVTLFGQSAGSMSIAFLLSSGQLQGLAKRVICQSGGASLAAQPRTSELSTQAVLATTSSASVADLQALPVAELLRAHAAIGIQRIGNPEATLDSIGDPAAFLPFRPVADGDLIPHDPVGAIAAGAGSGIDLMCGSTSEEWTLFSMMDANGGDPEVIAHRLRSLGVDPGEVLEAYAAEHPDADGRATMIAIMTDVVFRVPTHALADAHAAHGQVWMYRFSWASPVMDGMIGATHGMELPFQFVQTKTPMVTMFVGNDAPDSLVEHMHGLTVRFAAEGEAGAVDGVRWPMYVPNERSVLDIAERCTLLDDPLPLTRSVWEAHVRQASIANPAAQSV